MIKVSLFDFRWYADELLGHGRRVLSKARDIFSPFKIEISGKVGRKP
jgi:hypothetical protein